ncbi:hypothetical protein Dimus_021363 [Dionaea muscipula]
MVWIAEKISALTFFHFAFLISSSSSSSSGLMMAIQQRQRQPQSQSQSQAQTQQFLSSVLSQRGPSSLPYTEDVKWLIRQHLLSLTDAYPSLQPKTALFTHNDGRSVNLLQADGTLPTPYHGVTYNIPLRVWLLDSYPRLPPCVYLNPTRDMLIKRPHPHADPSGLVSLPYLHSWIYPTSNLLDLARNLIHSFSRDPPLYSNPNPNPSHSHSNQPTPSLPSSSNSNHSGSLSIPAPGMYPPSPYSGSSRITTTTTQRRDHPNEVFKRNAINKLVDSMHGDVVALWKTREDEMDGLFNAQAVLRQREEQLRKGVEEMMDEKEVLEQQLQMVLMNADVLEGWVAENNNNNGGKIAKPGSEEEDEYMDHGAVFEPHDPLSNQMLECTALDLAIEDVIYSLDKAVQEGAVPFDQYLRNVRWLSREQFIHRATSAKVRAAQMQAHVAAMAARASSQYVT